MRDKRKFLSDLNELKQKLEEVYGNIKLDDIVDKLEYHYELGLININHASIQLTVSAYLKSLGYRVFAEYEKKGRLLDIYAIGDVDIGIEVEYGYLPNPSAIIAEEYLMSRIALKILRYSSLSSKFYIAVPSFYAPPLPKELISSKDGEDAKKIIALIKRFHNINYIKVGDFKNIKLNGIINVNVSELKVNIIDIEKYTLLKHSYG